MPPKRPKPVYAPGVKRQRRSRPPANAVAPAPNVFRPIKADVSTATPTPTPAFSPEPQADSPILWRPRRRPTPVSVHSSPRQHRPASVSTAVVSQASAPVNRGPGPGHPPMSGTPTDWGTPVLTRPMHYSPLDAGLDRPYSRSSGWSASRASRSRISSPASHYEGMRLTPGTMENTNQTIRAIPFSPIRRAERHQYAQYTRRHDQLNRRLVQNGFDPRHGHQPFLFRRNDHRRVRPPSRPASMPALEDF